MATRRHCVDSVGQSADLWVVQSLMQMTGNLQHISVIDLMNMKVATRGLLTQLLCMGH